MRIIPKKTNVSMEFFNGFTSGDVAVGFSHIGVQPARKILYHGRSIDGSCAVAA